MRLSWFNKLYVLFVFCIGLFFLLIQIGENVNSDQKIDISLFILSGSALIVSYIGLLPFKYTINLVSLYYPIIYFDYGPLPIIIIDFLSLFLDKRIFQSVYIFLFNAGQLIISTLGAHFFYKKFTIFLPDSMLIHVLFFLSIYLAINNSLVISIMLLSDFFQKKIIKELAIIYLIYIPVYLFCYFAYINSPLTTILLFQLTIYFLKKNTLKKMKLFFASDSLESNTYLFSRQYVFSFLESFANNKSNFRLYLIEERKSDPSFLKTLRNLCGTQIFCRYTNDRILIISREVLTEKLSQSNLRFTEKIYSSSHNDNLETLLYELEHNLNQLTRKSARQRETALGNSIQLATIGQLAAGLAHEIRNPLTAVKGFLQLYRMGSRLDNDSIQLMKSELNRINQLVTDLLYLSASTAESNQREKHDLNHLVNEAAELFKPELDYNGIVLRLELAPLPPVNIDRNQIKQVVINLMQNALQAIKNNGHLTIQTRSTGNNVIFSIIDDGPGIPPELQDKIFDPFYTTKTDGTGLGLTICR